MALEKVSMAATATLKEGAFMWDVFGDTVTQDPKYDTVYYDSELQAGVRRTGTWLKSSQDSSTLQETSLGEYLLTLQPDGRQFKFTVRTDPRFPKRYFGSGTDLLTGQQVGYILEDLQPWFVPVIISGVIIVGVIGAKDLLCTLNAAIACGSENIKSVHSHFTYWPPSSVCDFECNP
jgi:hypothetical protein